MFNWRIAVIKFLMPKIVEMLSRIYGGLRKEREQIKRQIERLADDYGKAHNMQLWVLKLRKAIEEGNDGDDIRPTGDQGPIPWSPEERQGEDPMGPDAPKS
jgi:hypothetical protein